MKENKMERKIKPSTTAGASILIVDDNLSMCKTMSLILSRKGYSVKTAADGPEAIEKVREKSFDMIFMDIKMPVMDGVETYRRIKQIRESAVVVMMTAYSVENLIQQALEEGAYGILYKPLGIEKVVELIEKRKQAQKDAFILVVDDDPGICVLLKNILGRKSFKVGIAHSGEEAVTKAKENKFDIIFIDIKLPAINGLETHLKIKEINPEAVTIIITGYRQEVDELVEEALHHSAYTCFYKPLNMPEILQLVDTIWKRKQAEG